MPYLSNDVPFNQILFIMVYITSDIILSGTGDFQLAFIAAFFNTTLLTQLDTFFDALLFKLLCDGHQCVCMNASPFARLPLF